VVLAVLVILIAACGPSPTPSPRESGALPAGPTDATVPSPGPTDAQTSSPPDVASSLTSADKIEAARAAGRIDAPTALLYRVYATFGARELPAEFASDGWAEDGAALAMAIDQLDTLPTAIADELRPFLVRPTDPSSVFADTLTSDDGATGQVMLASVVVSPRLSSAAAAVKCTSGWGYVDGQSEYRIWGRCGSSASNGQLALVDGWMNTLWTDESVFMGRQPLEDRGGPDEGGDSRIDIYLVGSCITRAGTCVRLGKLPAFTLSSPEYVGDPPSAASSSFIVVNRAYLNDPVEGRGTLAHELFHVLQGSFNWQGTLSAQGYHWFVEASAQWAEGHFVPESKRGQYYFSQYQGTVWALQATDADNAYRSFVWPLFMEQSAPRGADSIADAWLAMVGKEAFYQLTEAVDAQLPFEEHFRDFAVRDWNLPAQSDAITTYFPADAVGEPRVGPEKPRLGSTVQLTANGAGTAPQTIADAVESLSVKYQPFKVDADVGQVTVDFSGLQPGEALDVDALLLIEGEGWERRSLSDTKTTFCKNVPADDVEEMVIVLSNHDLDATSLVLPTWTVQSLKEPCPERWIGTIDLNWVFWRHTPQWDGYGGNVRIANLADTVITTTLSVHLVLARDGGVMVPARGSTFNYSRTTTGLRPEPAVLCSGSLGIWRGHTPSQLADPDATGQAKIGGLPGGAGASVMVELAIGGPDGAPCLGGLGMYPFTMFDTATLKHDMSTVAMDADRLTYSQTIESHGTLTKSP
jgi:hypothetical protein